MKSINGVLFFSVVELVEILQTSRITIYNYIKRGMFRGVKLGGVYHVRKEEVDDYLGFVTNPDLMVENLLSHEVPEDIKLWEES